MACECSREAGCGGCGDAYGWDADLSDEQVLERLLALNLERYEGEGG